MASGWWRDGTRIQGDGEMGLELDLICSNFCLKFNRDRKEWEKSWWFDIALYNAVLIFLFFYFESHIKKTKGLFLIVLRDQVALGTKLIYLFIGFWVTLGHGSVLREHISEIGVVMSYWILRIKARFAAYKVSTIPAELALQPRNHL